MKSHFFMCVLEARLTRRKRMCASLAAIRTAEQEQSKIWVARQVRIVPFADCNKYTWMGIVLLADLPKEGSFQGEQEGATECERVSVSLLPQL